MTGRVWGLQAFKGLQAGVLGGLEAKISSICILLWMSAKGLHLC